MLTFIMKILLVSLTVGFGSIALGVDEDGLIQAVLQPVGRLIIQDASVELGELQQGASVEIRFPFVVTGEGPVKILGVHVDCGCLTSSIRPGTILDAGTKDSVKVTLDTKAFAGAIDKTILVMADEPRGDRLHRLVIHAKIRRMVEISPPLVRFDWTNAARDHEAIVNVRRLAEQTLSIEKVDFNRDNLEVEVQPAGDAWQVRIRWKGERPEGAFQDLIRISAAPPYGSLQIPVLGQGASSH